MAPTKLTKPGQCVFEQPGVKAPGTANKATFLPSNNCAVVNLVGFPSSSTRERKNFIYS